MFVSSGLLVIQIYNTVLARSNHRSVSLTLYADKNNSPKDKETTKLQDKRQKKNKIFWSKHLDFEEELIHIGQNPNLKL